MSDYFKEIDAVIEEQPVMNEYSNQRKSLTTLHDAYKFFLKHAQYFQSFYTFESVGKNEGHLQSTRP